MVEAIINTNDGLALLLFIEGVLGLVLLMMLRDRRSYMQLLKVVLLIIAFRSLYYSIQSSVFTRVNNPYVVYAMEARIPQLVMNLVICIVLLGGIGYALRVNDDKHHQAIDADVDSIIGIDQGSVIRYFSAGAEKMFQYSAADLLGTSVLRLIPLRYHEAHLEGMERFAETGKSRILGIPTRIFYRTASGAELPAEITIAAIGDREKGYSYTAILRDIYEPVLYIDDVLIEEKGR